MSIERADDIAPWPPYRWGGESVRRIMRTQFTALAIIAGFVVWQRGWAGLNILLIGCLASAGGEVLWIAVRDNRLPGDITHSVMIGLLFGFTQRIGCPWYSTFAGAMLAIIVAKHMAGGLGRYRLHPALVGWLFAFVLSVAVSGGTQWYESVMGIRPPVAVDFSNSIPLISEYLLGHLSPLESCMWYTRQDGLGEGARVLLILAGVYFIYRGYLRWPVPVVFFGGVVAASILLPLRAVDQWGHEYWIGFPVWAESVSTGISYISYQLFTGGVIFSGLILMCDSSSRPMMLRGQMIFALGAGILTVVVRLYTPVPGAAYVAMLAMSVTVPLLDKYTRRFC